MRQATSSQPRGTKDMNFRPAADDDDDDEHHSAAASAEALQTAGHRSISGSVSPEEAVLTIAFYKAHVPSKLQARAHATACTHAYMY